MEIKQGNADDETVDQVNRFRSPNKQRRCIGK